MENTAKITELREKTWEEKTDAEKIESLRSALTSIYEQFNDSIYPLQNSISMLRSDLFKHAHLEGKVVIPYDQYSHVGGVVTGTGLGATLRGPGRAPVGLR